MKLVKFGARWCQPCKTIKPILEKLTKENGLEFVEKDVDNADEMNELKALGIKQIPTVYFEKEDGSKSQILSGAQDYDTYQKVYEAFQ